MNKHDKTGAIIEMKQTALVFRCIPASAILKKLKIYSWSESVELSVSFDAWNIPIDYSITRHEKFRLKTLVAFDIIYCHIFCVECHLFVK